MEIKIDGLRLPTDRPRKVEGQLDSSVISAIQAAVRAAIADMRAEEEEGGDSDYQPPPSRRRTASAEPRSSRRKMAGAKIP